MDTFLNKKFDTTEDLQKATAAIVRENGGWWPMWLNKNVFDFLINLHRFNQNKDDSKKIKLHFSDLDINWNKLLHRSQWDSIGMLNRDSIMAYNIINQYIKDSAENRKMLIIMNTYHAWKRYYSAGQYIYEKFPDMANVLINGSTQEEMQRPMSSGLWDEAASEVRDSVWAIDFSKCPLGDLKFDLMSFNPYNFKYKDIFKGMIYYLHPDKWKIIHNYPYMLDNYEDTLLRRSALLGSDYLQFTEENINNGYYTKVEQTKDIFDIALLNFKFFIFHSLVLLFLFVNLLIFMGKRP